MSSKSGNLWQKVFENDAFCGIMHETAAEQKESRSPETPADIVILFILMNKTVRLHDLMDFNRAFQQYDILDGASCLTVGKRHLSQREAAMEALRKIGLNQFVDVAVDIFPKYKNWLIKFQVRLHALKANESFR